MIRQIKSLYTKTLTRILPPSPVDGKEIDADTLVHRRVEITVERESISATRESHQIRRDGGCDGT